MKWLGTKVVQLGDLRTPDDWQARLDAERNRYLGASIVQTQGPIHLPVVEAATGEIVAGADRIAAQVVAGTTSFEVRLWSGSPAERDTVRAHENRYRRPPTAAETKALVDARAALIAEALPDSQRRDTVPGHGVRKGTKAAARHDISDARGVKVESVRKQEQRARAKERTAQEPLVPPAPKPVPIERRLANVIEELREIDAALVKVVADLKVDDLARAVEEARRGRPYGSVAAQYEPGGHWRGGLAEALLCLSWVVERIDVGRRAMRRADRPPTEQERQAAGLPPKTGLGGRRLCVEGAQGELLAKGERPGSDNEPPRGA